MNDWLLASFVLSIVLACALTKDLGGSCQLGRVKQSKEGSPSEYYECSDEDNSCNNLDLMLGCWHMKLCDNGRTFSDVEQKCIDESRRRRQQSLCQKKPDQFGCPPTASCGAETSNKIPSVGSNCDWMNAPLAPSPNAVNDYMQCQRKAGNSCGMWNPQPCPMGGEFNPATETCVESGVQKTNQCGPKEAAVCGCTKEKSCPGASKCNKGACCQGITPFGPKINRPIPRILPSIVSPMVRPIRPTIAPRPMCPGTSNEAAGSCGLGCPRGMGCKSGGCCPNINGPGIINQVRPPIAQPEPFVQPRPTIPCPSGLPSQGPCAAGIGLRMGVGTGCLANQDCYQGQCCPLPQCPQTGMLGQGFCSQGCPANSQCFQGSCCVVPIVPQPILTTMPRPLGPQVQPPRPTVCPGSTQTAKGSCGQGCPQKSQCFRGGCCPQQGLGGIMRPQFQAGVAEQMAQYANAAKYTNSIGAQPRPIVEPRIPIVQAQFQPTMVSGQQYDTEDQYGNYYPQKTQIFQQVAPMIQSQIKSAVTNGAVQEYANGAQRFVAVQYFNQFGAPTSEYKNFANTYGVPRTEYSNFRAENQIKQGMLSNYQPREYLNNFAGPNYGYRSMPGPNSIYDQLPQTTNGVVDPRAYGYETFGQENQANGAFLVRRVVQPYAAQAAFEQQGYQPYVQQTLQQQAIQQFVRQPSQSSCTGCPMVLEDRSTNYGG